MTFGHLGLRGTAVHREGIGVETDEMEWQVTFHPMLSGHV
jgi:hypothetical protein